MSVRALLRSGIHRRADLPARRRSPDSGGACHQSHRSKWGYMTGPAVLIAIPVAIVFLLVQRDLVTGLTAGATKS